MNALKQKLTDLLPNIRFVYMLPALSKDELEIARNAWAEVLVSVPVARLEEIVMLAIREQPGERRRVLTAPDVLWLWRTIQREEQRRAEIVKRLEDHCTACGGTHTITVYSPDFGQDLRVPCPYHLKTEGHDPVLDASEIDEA